MCNYFIVKWTEIARTFGKADDVREMTANKSREYGEYGSLEHLLFLLFFHFVKVTNAF